MGKYDKLEQLSRLRQSDILSSEEFDREKAKLLASRKLSPPRIAVAALGIVLLTIVAFLVISQIDDAASSSKLSGSNTADTSGKAVPIENPALIGKAQAALEAVKGRLLDPGSATFADLEFYDDTHSVCGTVNAKNRFGGYVGTERFASDGADVVLAQDVRMPEPSAGVWSSSDWEQAEKAQEQTIISAGISRICDSRQAHRLIQVDGQRVLDVGAPSAATISSPPLLPSLNRSASASSEASAPTVTPTVDESAPPTPLNASDWLQFSDYPPDALRAEADGPVTVQLAVGSKGDVSKCVVTVSTGNVELDDQTCRLIPLRARFAPARDRRGKSTPAIYVAHVRWVLPS